MLDQNREALRIAKDLFERRPEWVDFYRETLGLGGAIRQIFSSDEALAQFQETDEYRAIQEMIDKLRRGAADVRPPKADPQRVITVRLPRSMHESLKAEAHTLKTSLNQLCIGKLLEPAKKGPEPEPNPTRAEA